MQFSGALLLGRGVAKTVRKGIVDPDLFEDEPEILMFGMLCALTAAGVWLIIATYSELPVSTTHSIIGYGPLCAVCRAPRSLRSAFALQPCATPHCGIRP